MSRPLLLHVSALSEAEYARYQSAYDELAIDGPDIGVREARGWLRGRGLVDGAVIDKILRYFHPNLGASDMLSAGQFYAALRLVTHAQAGATVTPDLVFVQPWLVPDAPSKPNAAPPPPSRPRQIVSDSESPNPPAHQVEPPKSAPATSTNPFSRPPPPPPSKSPKSSSDDASAITPPPLTTNASPSVVRSPPVSTNPFIIRAGTKAVSAPPSSNGDNEKEKEKVPKPTSPPLPPRKPLLPPPRHASLAPSPVRPIAGTSPKPPPKPAALSSTAKSATLGNTTSPLIKQSLLAAKATQRSAELGLEKLRTWEVIQSSSGNNSASSTSGTSNRPPLTPARSGTTSALPIISSGASVASSSSSVKATTIGAAPSSLPAPAAPIPDSPTTTLTRLGRSKSLHSPTGTPTGLTPPLPPPRRKRPESAQVSPSPSFAALLENSENELAKPAPSASASPRFSATIGPSAGGVSPFGLASRKDTARIAKARSIQSTTAFTHSPEDVAMDLPAPGSDPFNTPPLLPFMGRSFSHQPRSREASSSRAEKGGDFSPTRTPSHSQQSSAHSQLQDHLSSIQKTFTQLQLKAKPGLESARAKVEGKLVPGGYARWPKRDKLVDRNGGMSGSGAESDDGVGGGVGEEDEFGDESEVGSTVSGHRSGRGSAHGHGGADDERRVSWTSVSSEGGHGSSGGVGASGAGGGTIRAKSGAVGLVGMGAGADMDAFRRESLVDVSVGGLEVDGWGRLP